MQFPRHCVSPRNHIVGIATFADTIESSPNRIACETTPSARELPAFLAAHVGPMVCAWAAPRRIPRGWRACHGVNAHCQRFACERHAKSGAVAPKSQATLPATAHCRRLLPRWFATWAAPPRGATSLPRTVTSLPRGATSLPRGAASLTASGGSCAVRGLVRDVPADDIVTKRGELHH